MNCFKDLLKVTIIISLSCFFACSNDGDNLQCDEFSATLNDENWVSSSMSHSIVIDTNWIGGVAFRRGKIESTNSANERIIVYYDNPGTDNDACVTVGDYNEIPFDSALFHLTVMKFMDGDNNTYEASNSSFVITSCDESSRNIKGTFSFEDDAGNIVVSNGEFSVCY